jgi:hypothetical protein
MYARLGFRPAWRSMQFLRLPAAARDGRADRSSKG